MMGAGEAWPAGLDTAAAEDMRRQRWSGPPKRALKALRPRPNWQRTRKQITSTTVSVPEVRISTGKLARAAGVTLRQLQLVG